jgi:hypothetical protein
MNKTLPSLPSCLAPTPESKFMNKTLPYLPSCLASTPKHALRVTRRTDSALSPLPPLPPLSLFNKSLPPPPGERELELCSISSYEEDEGPFTPLPVSASIPCIIFPYESTLWGMMKAKCLPIRPTGVLKSAVPSLQIPVLTNAKRFGHSRGRAKERMNQ